MKISKILILSAAALSLAACGEHTHSFGEAWKSDETSHWHECECGEKSDKANHLDTNTDGKCDVCNHDMEVPAPTGTQVTQAEWEAAFGQSKPFYIADNYKINMENISEDDTKVASSFRSLSVDGLKARKVRSKNAEELDAEYSLKTQNGYTSYLWNINQEKWEKYDNASNPAGEFATFLTPFGTNYSEFSFDENTKSYKCASLNVGGTICTNMTIKFENKKIVSASLDSAWKVGQDSVNYHWQSAITYGGQTVTLPDIPQPSSNEVTSSEWVAAFGVNKPYYIADNYKMDVEMDAGGQTMATTIWVDDLKLKALQTQGIGADETYYNEIVDGQKYQYQFDEGTSKWTKNETSRSIADDFANYLEPFGASYTSFTFDNVAETYKCSSLSFGGHLFTNLSIKFENKQIAEISLSSVMEDEGRTPFTMTFEITYGGQTVTLPEIDPEPAQGMTEDEFNALVNKAYSKGFSFKTSTPQADCISSTIIFDCVNKNLYISENWKDEDFIGITVYFDSVVYFKSPMTGEWQEPRQLSSEELETQFNAGLAEYLMQILPTTDFSDFTFNPEDGTYEVTMNLSPYEGVEITMVYVYVMDANGITSISGTTTYVYGGETQTSTVSIYDVDIGEQEITPPEVEKKK